MMYSTMGNSTIVGFIMKWPIMTPIILAGIGGAVYVYDNPTMFSKLTSLEKKIEQQVSKEIQKFNISSTLITDNRG